MVEIDWNYHFKYYDLFQNNYPRYHSTIDFYIKQLKNFKKILDTGAGSGNITFELLKKGHEVTAVDFNKFALKILKKKCLKYASKLKILNLDVVKMNLEKNYFDGASSIFVVPFVRNLDSYFSKVYNSLRRGGKFVISAWVPIKGLNELAVKELGEIGFLDNHRKELNHIMKSSEKTLSQVLKGPKEKEILKVLEKVGFRKIKVHQKNPYGNYAYFISCIRG